VLWARVGEYKAKIVMTSAFALRSQIEAALADRIPSALTPAPRVIRPVMATGVGAVDEALGGGLPVGALTEMIGAECSGRTALALSFVAQVIRAEKVCVWVDASDALSPESAAACGVDLARLLWVRCGVTRKPTSQMRDAHPSQPAGRGPRDVGHPALGRNGFAVPGKYFVPPPVIKGLHGGGMGGHPRGEAKGMEAAVSGLLQPKATAARGVERQPQRSAGAESAAHEAASLPPAAWYEAKCNGVSSRTGRPWSRMEQALRATDLLLQAGGFGAIVLDMGSLAPKHVSRIPLATWFRYRAAAERTQASVLLLTQYACTKSSAGLVLRFEGGGALAQEATVLAGFERRIEVSRQRFAHITECAEKGVPIRKPPQRAGVATWHSQTTWAGRR
jgi:recombination protein RecA